MATDDEGEYAFEASRYLRPGSIGVALLVSSLVLSLVALNVPWFRVDTEMRFREYDPSTDDLGEDCFQIQGTPLCRASVDLDLKMLSLSSDMSPNALEDAIINRAGSPSYDDHAANSGTAMLGILLLQIVAFLSLAASVVLFFLHGKGGRDFGPSVWKFGALFAVFGLVTLGYFVVAVPGGAERDVRDILEEYEFIFQQEGAPPIHDTLLQPDIGFWKTDSCCEPTYHTVHQGQDIAVAATTISRPAAGFWLQSLTLLTFASGLILATRGGRLDTAAPGDAAAAPSAETERNQTVPE